MMETQDQQLPPLSMAARIEAFVRRLSFPRYVGTANEVKARGIIKDTCKAMDIAYTLDPFKTSDFFMKYINIIPYYLMGLYVLAFSLVMLVAPSPLPILVMAGILLVLVFSIEGLLRAVKYPAMYCRFAQLKESENIVMAQKSIASGGSDPSKRVNVYFLAHSDGKTEKPDPQVWFVIEYIAISFGSMALSAHAIVYAMLGLLGGGVFPHASWGFFYGIILALIDMLRISTAYYEGDSPGASDDAIGVAIELEFMNRIKTEAFQHVNVTSVITGAEEVGEAGAYQFIKTRAASMDKKTCHFIAIDGMCNNKVRYFTSLGYSFKKFSPLVRRALESVIAKNHESVRAITFSKSWMPPPVNTDHSAVVKLGYKAFVMESNVGVTHTARDTPEVIDYGFAASFVDFLVALVHEMDTIAGRDA